MATGVSDGDMAALLRRHIEQSLQPLWLDVVDESQQHRVPLGAQSHFRVTVVATAFEGVSLVARHRRIYHLLAAPLADSVHALALHCWTPEEWRARGGKTLSSPPCLGGEKRS